MAKDKKYFWIKKGEQFGGEKTGTDITDLLGDDQERIKKMLKQGLISETEPITAEQAAEGELHALRKTIKNQDAEIADLKNQLESVPKTVKAANEKIKALEAELEALTRPEKGGK